MWEEKTKKLPTIPMWLCQLERLVLMMFVVNTDTSSLSKINFGTWDQSTFYKLLTK